MIIHRFRLWLRYRRCSIDYAQTADWRLSSRKLMVGGTSSIFDQAFLSQSIPSYSLFPPYSVQLLSGQKFEDVPDGEGE